VGVYLALGAIGATVFAGGRGGLGVLLGPTGGYLVGFLVGAVVGALVRARLTRRRVPELRADLGAGFSTLGIVYLAGWLQLALGTDASALRHRHGVLPFVIADGFKTLPRSRWLRRCGARGCTSAHRACSLALRVRTVVGRQSRQPYDETRAAFGQVLGVDAPVVRAHDRPDDGEPQSCSAGAPVAARLGAIETVEEVGKVLGRDARAVVGYGEYRPSVLGGEFERDVPACVHVTARVVDEVCNHLLEPV
jgi:hypothetical protein